MPTTYDDFEELVYNNASKISTQWENIKKNINRNKNRNSGMFYSRSNSSDQGPLCPVKDLKLLTLKKYRSEYYINPDAKYSPFFAMEWAAEFGFLEVVKFLHTNSTEDCNYTAMDIAA